MNTENILLFVAVAGEIGFLCFDGVIQALAFHEANLKEIADHNKQRLKQHEIQEISIYQFILDHTAMLQIVLQTYCLLTLTNEECRLTMHSSLKGRATICLSYMIVCNFAIWGSCSFIEADYSEGNSLYLINEIVLGSNNWKFVSVFLYPLVLYFRFHSTKMILISLNRIHSAASSNRTASQ